MEKEEKDIRFVARLHIGKTGWTQHKPGKN